MRTVSAGVTLVAVAIAGCGGGSSSTSTNSLTTVKNPQTQSAPTSATATSAGPQPTRGPADNKSASQPLPALASPAQTVRAALTSTDTAVCELYTRRLLKKSFGGAPGCRSSIRSGGRADSVEIVSVQPEGRHALIVTVPHGGPSSAQKLQISLVRGGRHWQLASIKSNVPVGP
jgi:hypothetical protein